MVKYCACGGRLESRIIAKRFWTEVWDRYVDKQKYDREGRPKKGFEDKSDSYLVAQAVWAMSDKEFKQIINKTLRTR